MVALASQENACLSMNPIRFSFFPSSTTWRTNPYLDLLQTALEEQGAVFVPPDSDYLTWRWLLRQRGRVDVLHFHWIQYQYAFGRRPWFDLLRFLGKLALARTLGYRLVWTAHNLLPHESEHPRLDWLARLFMTHVSHTVIVHCEEGRRQLAARFKRREGVIQSVLGTYQVTLNRLIDKKDARRQLGLAEQQLVFLFFGGIRYYKGVQELADAFTRLREPEAKLLIVGPPFELELVQFLTACSERDQRLVLCLEFVDDTTLQLYLSAADVAVLPFKQVLTSSSVMTALSAGLPVVVPALGCLPELLTPSCGILYDPQQPDGLLHALQQIRALDLLLMSNAARQRAAQFTWADAARYTLRAYGIN